MSTTVHVQGISHETNEKEVKDFFSFCGKITNLSITPVSSDADAQKSATVTFEKETAAKTALLLDNTQLGKSQVHVTTASSIDQVATQAGSATTSAAQAAEDHIPQEDKPRSRIVAEYLAHGYTLSDNVIQKAIAVDQKQGISHRFTSALQNFDSKYKVTDKSKEMDSKYQVSNKAMNAWGGLNSYFERAMETPTGQRVRDYYVQGAKQVADVHSEARRLADLKKGTQEPHPVAGESGKTACSCGGAEGVCGCAPGQCACANCGKSDNPSKSVNPPQEVKGTQKTVCTCGGKDGVCGCEPGKCACASCGKASHESVTEVKEAAQASGQTLPKETFGATA
ncbi:Protein vip1 [Exophiala xenobiotica]|uniref:Protein vip1 n=1 Tax=Lithohypha guttulata TaxID=1690604 RepID=A0ABR0KGG0_9EURO|nr:Protein vip1 [Lithohypha guttulata]KAK5323549.1 Protein vip1 [Exophiala xenobiotica]